MSWYGNTNLILVQPQPGFFHNSELLSKSVKVVVPAWKEGMMVSIWENRRPATNLNNTLRLVFQPHLGTCGSHGLESWLGLKSLSFLSDVFMSKKLAVSGCFLSYFICIYIYYTRLLHVIWLVYVWGFLIYSTPHFGGCCFPIPLSMASFLIFYQFPFSVSFLFFLMLILNSTACHSCLYFCLRSCGVHHFPFPPHRIPLCIAIKIKNNLNQSFITFWPPTHPPTQPRTQALKIDIQHRKFQHSLQYTQKQIEL